MSDIQNGIYRAKGIAGSEQLGKTKNGHDQVVIDMHFLDIDKRASTFLIFSDDAAPYSLERLKALGWGGGDDFVGIDKNEVQVEVKNTVWDGKPQMKIEILTGGGRVVLKEQMSEPEKRGFFARVNALATKPKPVAGKDYPKDWDNSGAPAPAGAKPARVTFE